MEQKQNAQDDSDRENGSYPDRQMRPVTIVSLSIIVFLLVIGLWWVFLGDHITDEAKRAEVWVQSLLSTAILIVVAVQACIYFRQAKALDRQVRHSARQIKISNKLAETALKQFEITDRPWMSFDAAITGPLRFINQNVELIFRFTAKNVGRSVAVNTTINARIIVPSPNVSPDIWGQVLTEQRKICENVLSRYMSQAIFPDGIYSLDLGLGLERHEAEQGRLGGADSIRMYLVGCVDYQFAGHESHHQTRFAYEVYRTRPDRPGILTIQVGKDVPPDQLALMKMYIGDGDYAD